MNIQIKALASLGLLLTMSIAALAQSTPQKDSDQAQSLMERDAGLRWAWERPKNKAIVAAASTFYRGLMLNDVKGLTNNLAPGLPQNVMQELKALVDSYASPDVRHMEVISWKSVKYDDKPGILMLTRAVSLKDNKQFNQYLWTLFFQNEDEKVLTVPFDLLDNPEIRK